MIGGPPRQVTDALSPALARIEGEGKRTEVNRKDFTWFSDPVTRWRAAALAGGLTVFDALFLWDAASVVTGPSSTPGVGLIALGAAVLVVGGMTVSWFGAEYAAAVAVGGGVAMGLGFYLYQTPQTPATDLVTTALAVGLVGGSSLGLGVVRSIQLSGKYDEDGVED